MQASSIFKRLNRFLLGEVTLDQFEDWFVQNSWNAHKTSPEEVLQIIGAIELRLAELSSGHLSLRDLHSELTKLMHEWTVPTARVYLRFGTTVTTTQIAQSANLTFRFGPKPIQAEPASGSHHLRIHQTSARPVLRVAVSY
jgi:hypothetical protein